MMEAVESCVPPGFRFHPTEEELVGYYLKRKVNSNNIDLDVITDIDLYRIEPWDLQDRCKLGYEDRNEWYFFSHKDKKYPTGTRTNRATAAGFWKATGRDKPVLSKQKIIGMRKTLVFYKGRAPNGNKTDWIMHEYRLQTFENAPPQDEGWVVCRAFKKPTPSHRQRVEAWNHSYYVWDHHDHSRFGTKSDTTTSSSMHHPIEDNLTHLNHQLVEPNGGEDTQGQLIDWKSMDKLLASQLTEIASSTHCDLFPLNYNNDYDVNGARNNQGNNLLDSFPDL